MSGAVRNLIVSVEAYPDLKSNTNFLELQRQLAETEDRIANGRRYYNANVRVYNTKAESVPTNIIANIFKFEKATYFEVNDQAVRQAPDVSFGEIAYRGDSTGGSAQGQLPPQASAPPVQFGQPSDDHCRIRSSTSSSRSSRHISSRRSSSPRSTSRHLRPLAAATSLRRPERRRARRRVTSARLWVGPHSCADVTH